MFNQGRAQVLAIWQRITITQRIVLGVLLALGIALVAAFSYWAGIPDYGVAFSGLSEGDAGGIVDKLKAANIPYQLAANGAILVPKSQIYDVRLSMAKDGLPNGSTVGFELFDTNNLGLTEFSQKVNYQRALEGELDRTIESLDSVKAARVHIVMPDQALFANQQRPTTASVTLQLNPGHQMAQDQVQAITHLVASSVEGLKPEAIVVVDTEGQMLSEPSSGNGVNGLSDSQRAFQHQYEAGIESKVEDMLVQALGPNKSVVRVSANLNWDQVETTKQVYEATPVARSSSIISETYSGTGSPAGGIPGAASNLPQTGAPTYQANGTQTANSGYQRNETTINYEIGSIQTHQVVTPGQVQKLSVSVLVDNVTDAAKLTALTAIASSAAGIDVQRGDQVTVQSIAFDRTYFTSETAAMDQAAQTDLYVKIGVIVGILLLALLLVWFVSRLMGNIRLMSTQDIWTPLIGAPTQPLSLAAGAPRAAAELGAAPTYVAASPTLAAPVATPAAVEQVLPALLQLQSKPQTNPELEQIQRALMKLTEQRPATAAEIIRLWIEEDGPRK